MNWKILGIEPTKDTDEIKKAYRHRLVSVNPEDHPEEFKELRAAYEEALRLASEDDVPSEKSEVDKWMERVASVYRDFKRRCDPAEWKALMDDDVCVSLDSKGEAEEKLLVFFMNECMLPTEVWKVIDERFSFSDRREELIEKFPADFIDYGVINGILYGPSAPCRLFEPGTDGDECDRLRAVFMRLRSVHTEEEDENELMISSMSEHHPYSDALVLKRRSARGDREALDELRKLADRFPGEDYVMNSLTEALYEAGEYEEALGCAGAVLEREPSSRQAQYDRARCLASLERYKEAVDVLNGLMRTSQGDPAEMTHLDGMRHEYNEKLITGYEERIKDEPDNDTLRFDLAWCYLQNGYTEKCLETVRDLPEGSPDAFSYYNLTSQLYSAVDDFKRALEDTEKLIDVIKNMKDDGTEKTRSQLSRLPEMIERRAIFLYNVSDDKLEAIKALEEAAEAAPAADTFNRLVAVCLANGEYRRADEYSLRLVREWPDLYYSHVSRALSCYRIHSDREAYEEISKAISMEGSDLNSYILRIMILIRNSSFDPATEEIEMLESYGLGESVPLMWVRGLMKELKDRDMAGAEELYRKILAKGNEAESFMWFPNICYRLAELTADRLSDEDSYSEEPVLEILEKGLQKYPRDEDLLLYKAWLLKNMKRTEEAKEIYLSLEKREQHSFVTERNLAEIYYADLYRHAPEAYRYYKMMLDREPDDPDTLFYAGWCLVYLRRYEEAEKCFLREMELEPSQIDSYYRLHFIYLDQGRYQEALKMIDKVIEIAGIKQMPLAQYLVRKRRLLRRMGNVEEAVAVSALIAGSDEKYRSDIASIEIYEQFGYWDMADRIISSERGRGIIQQKDRELSYHEVKTLLLTGKLQKAQSILKTRRSSFGQERYNELCRMAAMLKGEYAHAKKMWQDELAAKRSEGEVSFWIYSQLAKVCWFRGDSDASVYAKESEKLLAGNLEMYTRDEKLYRTAMTNVLIYQGRLSEAREMLEKASVLPLCESCEYGGCKDALMSGIYLEIAEGKLAAAGEMAGRAHQMYPDEEDFIIILNHLNRIG